MDRYVGCSCAHLAHSSGSATPGHVKVQVVIAYDYGFHQDEKFSFLVFFQFLVSRREMRDEKREINFLHFLPNFLHFLANIGLFWWFFKVLQCFKRHRQLIGNCLYVYTAEIQILIIGKLKKDNFSCACKYHGT